MYGDNMNQQTKRTTWASGPIHVYELRTISSRFGELGVLFTDGVGEIS